jgi:phospholipase/carboxylesterase
LDIFVNVSTQRTPLLAIALALLGAMVTSACAGEAMPEVLGTQLTEEDGATAKEGRITARPRRTAGGKPRYGLHELGITRQRDALVYVPDSYDPKRPAPLVLGLHGANGGPSASMGRMMPRADDAGMIVVGVASREQSWDVIYGGFGPDVAIINRALDKVFDRYAVDPSRVGIEGFSDGASYALSLGLTNGDLFKSIMAFSPGFMTPGDRRGKPRMFIAHGTEDTTLPIDRTSREIVPELRDDGYRVKYIEFDGRHKPYPPATDAAVEWFLRR